MSESAKPLGEFDMIARLFAPLAGEGAFGLLDDAATLFPAPKHDLVITKDMLVEDVHFFAQDPPASIARKALRVNLSDLAAKGAQPRGFLLGLARGPVADEAWLEAFAAALGEDASAYATPLLGGDSVKAPVTMLSITAFGEVPQGRMVPRQGGKAGDLLYVSGTIGDGALGLALRLAPDAPWTRALNPEHRAHLLARYLEPQPRMALAPALRAHASAAMDISDGLVGDAEKLAAHLGRSMDIASAPFSPAAQDAIALHPALLETALTGGDDYEIFCAVSPEKAALFEQDALQAGVRVVRIGRLEDQGAPNLWRDAQANPQDFTRKSYRHF